MAYQLHSFSFFSVLKKSYFSFNGILSLTHGKQGTEEEFLPVADHVTKTLKTLETFNHGKQCRASQERPFHPHHCCGSHPAMMQIQHFGNSQTLGSTLDPDSAHVSRAQLSERG